MLSPKIDIYICLYQCFYYCDIALRLNSKLGEEGFIWLTLTSHSLKEDRIRTLTGQEPGVRSCYSDHGGVLLTDVLFLACSTCFLINPRTIGPRIEPQTMGWALHDRSLIEKMPYVWVSCRHFHNWSSLLSDRFSLCKVEMKLESTISTPPKLNKHHGGGDRKNVRFAGLRGLLWDIFMTWHGLWTHELTADIANYTKPTQVNQCCRPEQIGRHVAPPLAEETLAVGWCWEKGNHFNWEYDYR